MQSQTTWQIITASDHAASPRSAARRRHGGSRCVGVETLLGATLDFPGFVAAHGRFPRSFPPVRPPRRCNTLDDWFRDPLGGPHSHSHAFSPFPGAPSGCHLLWLLCVGFLLSPSLSLLSLSIIFLPPLHFDLNSYSSPSSVAKMSAAYGGYGPNLLAAGWTLAGAATILMVMRLYAFIRVTRFAGWAAMWTTIAFVGHPEYIFQAFRTRKRLFKPSTRPGETALAASSRENSRERSTIN